MPRSIFDRLEEFGFLIGCILALLAIGGCAVWFLGFAWAVLVAIAVAALIYRLIPVGDYGEGAIVIISAWILLALGIGLGMVLRLVGS